MNNQDVIDAFDKAGRSLGEAGLAMMGRAGLLLSTLIEPPAGRRGEPYTGPPIDTLPGLSNTERAALRAAMGAQATDTPASHAASFISWEHRAEPGLHGPSDSVGGWTKDAFAVVERSKVRAVKVLVPNIQQSEVDRLLQINSEMFIMGRLFSAQLNQRQARRGDGTPTGVGHWFANEVADETDRTNPLTRAVGAGIQYFEVHNEPNLTDEGLTVNWQDGEEFALFYESVVNDLRPRFPNTKFGFPGLSPGAAGGTRLIEMYDFLQQAQRAVAQADFLCCHFYWGNEGIDRPGARELLREFCGKFPDKKIICSEFSNNNTDTDREEKAKEYAQFYQDCKNLPSNLGAMFAFAISWHGDRHNEGFLELTHDGQFRMTAMADVLGAHTF
jgi:hypothetical protein